MRLGIHVSIAGGMAKMAQTALDLGCEAVQIFSRSPRGGKAKEFSEPDVAQMKAIFKENDIWPVVVHVPYFLNLASSDPEKVGYSRDVLVEDLYRAQVLGAKYLVTHLGHKGKDEAPDSIEPLTRVVLSLENVLSRYSGPVKILLENTAGQGQEIGASFEALASIMAALPKDRVGACLDTCHAFAAGYDLRTKDSVDSMLDLFDATIGLSNLGAVHLNDCKSELGRHLDRHEMIGSGCIGEEGIEALINNPRLPRDLPGLLETPFDSLAAAKSSVETVKNLRARHAGSQH